MQDILNMFCENHASNFYNDKHNTYTYTYTYTYDYIRTYRHNKILYVLCRISMYFSATYVTCKYLVYFVIYVCVFP